MSDLIEEGPTSQIIYDSTKSNSLMLSGTDITISNIINNNEIKLNALGIKINGDAGTAGQVLTSNGESSPPSWTTGSGTTPSLQDVCVVDPNTGGINFIDSGNYNLATVRSNVIDIYQLNGNPDSEQANNHMKIQSNGHEVFYNWADPSNNEKLFLGVNGLEFGYVHDNATNFGVIKYMPTGISANNTFNIETSAGLNLQGVGAGVGQVITADSSGNPVWATCASVSTILDASNNFTQPNTFTTIDASTINATTINADHLTVNQLPTTGNELVTKSYVDSLVGQYSGGLNLYLNYSTTNGIYKELSNKINSNATQSINTQLVTDITYSTIASFITPSAYPGISVIPRGIWNMTVYGDVSSNSAGTVNYYFKIYKYISDISSVLIATSTPSNDVNSLTAYYIQATVPETSMNLTDRILINLDISSNGAPINTNICTYFENDYYSYIQTSLNDGTNILSAYNTWTGNNDFSTVGLKTTTIDSDSTALTIGGTTTSSLVLGKVSNTTNIQGNLQIEGQSGTSGQVLTSAGSGSSPTWTTPSGGWIGTATGNLNMGTNTIGGTTTLNISTPIQPTGLTYGVTGTGNQYSIGYKNILTLPAVFDLSQSNILLPIPNFNIQVTPGVWLVQGYIVCNSASTITTYNRISIVVGSGARGSTNGDITNDTHTNVVLNASSNQGNQISFNVISVFSTNITTYINVSVNANGPTSTVLLKFPITNYISVTRIA
jgi:hypothetical protein